MQIIQVPGKKTKEKNITNISNCNSGNIFFKKKNLKLQSERVLHIMKTTDPEQPNHTVVNY